MLKTVSNNFIIDSLNHACFMRNITPNIILVIISKLFSAPLCLYTILVPIKIQ